MPNDPNLEPKIVGPTARQIFDARKENPEKAFAQLEARAKSGSGLALFYAADLFMRGAKTPEIIARAQHLNELAKDRKLKECFFYFGKGFYRAGEVALAADAFSWGSELEYAPSAYALARIHFDGWLGSKDLKKSKTLLELAASKGNIPAKKDLAYVLMFRDFGWKQKFRGALLQLTMFYYQIDLLVRNVRGRGLGERYLH